MPEEKKGFYTKRTRVKGYTSVPVELLTVDTAIIKGTGEEVKITDTIKIVYIYMRNQYCRSLDNSSSDGYYEGWESIATSLGKAKEIFKQGVNQPHKALEKLGLLEVTKAKKGRANLKVVKDIIEIAGTVTFLNTKSSDYKKKRDKEREVFITQRLKTGEEEKAKVVIPTPVIQPQAYNIPDPTAPWEFELDEEVPPF